VTLVQGEDLNRRLEILLKTFLIHDRKMVDRLFKEFGPLGSLRSRIEMAAALGLISDVERYDLNLIRAIRNHLAHHPFREVSFQDEKIKDRCAQLKTPLQFDDELFAPLLHGSTAATIGEPEYQFIKACVVLTVTLIARTHNAVGCQTPRPLTDIEIRTAISGLSREPGFWEVKQKA
jgi:DNA-binding MltR family transcriptional regulator